VGPIVTAEDVRRDVRYAALSGGQVDFRNRDGFSQNYNGPIGTSAELDAGLFVGLRTCRWRGAVEVCVRP